MDEERWRTMLRRPVDTLLRGLVRLALGVFFRDIEVVGSDRLAGRARHSSPDAGPIGVVYVGNHYNGLIDPALALGWLPPGIRTLAKSTLWSHIPAGLFVRLAGAVPVYRQMDAGADTSRNVEMFARCFEILGHGGSIALFPEGLSHNEPGLQKLKTGAARIALGTQARHPDSAISIVPFGLIFEERERFRSRALIEIGQPIEVRRFTTVDAERDRIAVQALTASVESGLAEVTLNFSSWHEADLLRRTASLYVREQADTPRVSGLADDVPYQRAFALGWAQIKRLYPAEAGAVRRSAEGYFGMLDLVGLNDRQVGSEYPFALVARFVLRSALEFLVLLPLGLVGGLIHWLPYKIPGWVVRLLPIGRDQHATYKVMISLVLFPLVWLAGMLLVLSRWGQEAALAFLVLGPLSGYVALLLGERLQRLLHESRAYLVLRGGGSLAATLRKRRRELLRSILDLVDKHSSIRVDGP